MLDIKERQGSDRVTERKTRTQIVNKYSGKLKQNNGFRLNSQPLMHFNYKMILKT